MAPGATASSSATIAVSTGDQSPHVCSLSTTLSCVRGQVTVVPDPARAAQLAADPLVAAVLGRAADFGAAGKTVSAGWWRSARPMTAITARVSGCRASAAVTASVPLSASSIGSPYSSRVRKKLYS